MDVSRDVCLESGRGSVVPPTLHPLPRVSVFSVWVPSSTRDLPGVPRDPGGFRVRLSV